MRVHPAATLALATAVFGQTQYTATSVDDVAKAAATARTESPTSHVKGKAFDRLCIIWLENTNYELAEGDRKPRICPTHSRL